MMPRAETAPQRLKRQGRLLREIAAALRANKPTPFSLSQPQEKERILEIQEYFNELRSKVLTKNYFESIRHWEQVNHEELKFTKGEYHRQWRWGLWPFIPTEYPLEDMPKLHELLGQRGRPRSEINDAITTLLARDPNMSARRVCDLLDQQKVSPPKTDTWCVVETHRERAVSSWKEAYNEFHLKSRIDRRVSGIRRRIQPAIRDHR